MHMQFNQSKLMKEILPEIFYSTFIFHLLAHFGSVSHLTNIFAGKCFIFKSC